MEYFLQFIYYGEVSVPANELDDLVRVARELGIKGENKKGVIHDHLGLTYIPASNDHYFDFKNVLFFATCKKQWSMLAVIMGRSSGSKN